MQKKALVVSLSNEQPQAQVEKIELAPLPPDWVRVQVAYSDINYKDALTLKAHSGVLRDYPRVPGIDFTGWVTASHDRDFQIGDQVAGIGREIGIQIDGGYQETVDVPGEFLHLLNGQRTLQDAALIGTAGLTAAIGLTKVLDTESMADRNAAILITGVTGGVGGWQLALLASLGYHNLTVITRQVDLKAQLLARGAKQVLTPEQVLLPALKPLAKQKFQLVFDNVGGDLLANLIPQVSENGHLVVSGNAGGIKLTTTILPFILRGVTLHGIDSVNYPHDDREEIWQLFETAFWPAENLRPASQKITFAELLPILTTFTTQAHFGRTIVKFRSRRPRF
ncbi:acrylyl-CoA reductase family protein [Lapidilactobacillus wuchangensis]|uniref:acrylyl-CoA reductase family protein n=1 Tax=Lapidilactobacillus wuchangensis TaxID=2486001 RepID=UPI000F7A3AE6|nr:acryloyl-CoA reductase [Lapidilactobacillus wuchangensis]